MDGASENNLLKAFIPIDVVNLPQSVLNLLGPVAPIAVTLLNGLAMVVILWFLFKLVRVSWWAFQAVTQKNDGGAYEFADYGSEKILRLWAGQLAMSFVMTIILFLVVTQGLALLYAVTSILGGLVDYSAETNALPNLFGPFKGMAEKALSAIMLIILVVGSLKIFQRVWALRNGNGKPRFFGADKVAEGDAEMGDIDLAKTAKEIIVMTLLLAAILIGLKYGLNILLDTLIDVGAEVQDAYDQMPQPTFELEFGD
jgi:hypothetical protein